MNKLEALRVQMLEQNIDGYIVPMADEFGSEYLPADARRLQWLTGFAGSVGLVIMLKQKCAFFTDGRYVIQSKEQVSNKDFEIYNIADMKPEDWCLQNLLPEDELGFDPWLFTDDGLVKYYKASKAGGFNLVAMENLIDKIWLDRPVATVDKIFIHDIKYTGQSSEDKRKIISQKLKEDNIDAAIIAVSESVNWLLNIRGNDLPHTPFALSYVIIDASGKVDLYIDEHKVRKDVRENLGAKIRIWSLADMLGHMGSLKGKNVLVDPSACPSAIINHLHEVDANIISGKDVCMLLKACKNKVEISGAINAHIRDGAALSTFFCWLENQTGLTEITASDKLEKIRSKGDLFKGLSFDTISGFGSNGAIVHYKASQKSQKKLTEGMYLLDSGGQYLDGTTDVTRTIYLGEQPTKQMKKHFTLVLKGHIALATAKFPIGTTGSQLDSLARQFLWQEGLDYDHGTGHGVGSYMNVHEGPHGISKRANSVALQEGMIISNEPGFYLEGEYGIRIENLITVIPSSQGFLEFKTLTQTPIDGKLIDKSMLSKSEINWINQYHKQVLELVNPLLGKDAKEWLKQVTNPI